METADKETKTIIHNVPLVGTWKINSREELQYFLALLLEFDETKCQDDEQLDNDVSFVILNELLDGKYPMTIFVENLYVDRVYRDSYYLYYSSKHKRYRRFCKRISIFNKNFAQKTFTSIPEEDLEQAFMGTMVIRPLSQGGIGRSLLNPFFFTPSNSFIRLAKYKVVVWGKQLEVQAFPFSMQDGETTTCSETVILNLMDYFSRKYQDYKFAFPSEISGIIDRHGYERKLPSRGLSFFEISRVFSEVGFFPRLYSDESFSNISQLKHNMHYYIESGIPVAIGVEKPDPIASHAITCIGHVGVKNRKKRIQKCQLRSTGGGDLWVADTADIIDEYIFMDDGKTPYKRYRWGQFDDKTKKIISSNQDAFGEDRSTFEGYRLKSMMIPLYKRMFLEAEDAVDIFLENLGNERVGIARFLKDYYGEDTNIGSPENPLVARVFLASSRHFRQVRIEDMQKQHNQALNAYTAVLFPKFVWVCEVYTVDSYCKSNPRAIGEIVLDATASKFDMDRIIIFHYPNNIRISDYREINDIDFYPNEFDKLLKERCNSFEPNYFKKLDKWTTLKPYDHNLMKPSKVFDCKEGK